MWRIDKDYLYAGLVENPSRPPLARLAHHRKFRFQERTQVVGSQVVVMIAIERTPGLDPIWVVSLKRHDVWISRLSKRIVGTPIAPAIRRRGVVMAVIVDGMNVYDRGRQFRIDFVVGQSRALFRCRNCQRYGKAENCS